MFYDTDDMANILDITNSGNASESDADTILATTDRIERKTIAFTGAAGLGDVGTVPLFIITGLVLLIFTGRCTENLAGPLATVEIGIAGSTNFVLSTTTATDIDNGAIITASAAISPPIYSGVDYLTVNDADIIATVGTAPITDGTLEIVALWKPLSSDGNVTAA